MTHKTANVQFGLDVPLVLMSVRLGADGGHVGTRINGIEAVPLPLQDDLAREIYNGIHAGLGFSERPLPDKCVEFEVTLGPIPKEFSDTRQIHSIVAGTAYTLFENLMCAHSSD